MAMLTKRQITRQDFVDKQIFDLVNALLTSTKQIGWDIEVIGNIRASIYEEIKKIFENMDEQQFYPFTKI